MSTEKIREWFESDMWVDEELDNVRLKLRKLCDRLDTAEEFIEFCLTQTTGGLTVKAFETYQKWEILKKEGDT